MKKLLICIFLLCNEHAFSIEDQFSDSELENISASDFSLRMNSANISDNDKLIIVNSILKSKRLDLMLAGLNDGKIAGSLIREFNNMPENSFKAEMIVGILSANDSLWSGGAHITKGERYKELGALCLNSLNKYFPGDPVLWDELLSMEKRKAIASDLNDTLKGIKVVKRTKVEVSNQPENEISPELNLGFDEGWEINKTSKDGNISELKTTNSKSKDFSNKRNNNDEESLSKDLPESVSNQSKIENFVFFSLLFVIAFSLLKYLRDKHTRRDVH